MDDLGVPPFKETSILRVPSMGFCFFCCSFGWWVSNCLLIATQMCGEVAWTCMVIHTILINVQHLECIMIFIQFYACMKCVLYVLQMIGTNSPGSNPKVQKHDGLSKFESLSCMPLESDGVFCRLWPTAHSNFIVAFFNQKIYVNILFDMCDSLMMDIFQVKCKWGSPRKQN